MRKHCDKQSSISGGRALTNLHISLFPHQADLVLWRGNLCYSVSAILYHLLRHLCWTPKGINETPKGGVSLSGIRADILLAFWQTATTSNSLKPLSADFSLLLIPKVASQTVVSQVVQWIDADDTAFMEKYYVKQKQIALNVIFLVLLLQDWFPACLQDNISFDFPFYEKLKLRVRDSAECTNAHLLVIFMYLLIMCYIVFHEHFGFWWPKHWFWLCVDRTQTLWSSIFAS